MLVHTAHRLKAPSTLYSIRRYSTVPTSTTEPQPSDPAPDVTPASESGSTGASTGDAKSTFGIKMTMTNQRMRIRKFVTESAGEYPSYPSYRIIPTLRKPKLKDPRHPAVVRPNMIPPAIRRPANTSNAPDTESADNPRPPIKISYNLLDTPSWNSRIQPNNQISEKQRAPTTRSHWDKETDFQEEHADCSIWYQAAGVKEPPRDSTGLSFSRQLLLSYYRIHGKPMVMERKGLWDSTPTKGRYWSFKKVIDQLRDEFRFDELFPLANELTQRDLCRNLLLTERARDQRLVRLDSMMNSYPSFENLPTPEPLEDIYERYDVAVPFQQGRRWTFSERAFWAYCSGMGSNPRIPLDVARAAGNIVQLDESERGFRSRVRNISLKISAAQRLGLVETAQEKILSELIIRENLVMLHKYLRMKEALEKAFEEGIPWKDVPAYIYEYRSEPSSANKKTESSAGVGTEPENTHDVEARQIAEDAGRVGGDNLNETVAAAESTVLVQDSTLSEEEVGSTDLEEMYHTLSTDGFDSAVQDAVGGDSEDGAGLDGVPAADGESNTDGESDKDGESDRDSERSI